jgi:hypothetical protein
VPTGFKWSDSKRGDSKPRDRNDPRPRGRGGKNLLLEERNDVPLNHLYMGSIHKIKEIELHIVLFRVLNIWCIDM